jgi:hypothetical protein
MEYFVVERFGECLEAMDRGGFNTCGVNLERLPPSDEVAYAGNFW